MVLITLSLGACRSKKEHDLLLSDFYGDLGTNSVKVEWHLEPATLSNQLRWNPPSEAIPLAPARACSIARKRLEAEFPSEKDWIVARISLVNVGDSNSESFRFETNLWFYTIEFSDKDASGGSRVSTHRGDVRLLQVVLLDGTVVRPKILALTRDERSRFRANPNPRAL